MTWGRKRHRQRIMISTSLSMLLVKRIRRGAIGKRSHRIKDGYLALHRYNVESDTKLE